jgi:hypothetical protein
MTPVPMMAPWDSCIGCFAGDTKTAFAVEGEAEWHIAALAQATVRQSALQAPLPSPGRADRAAGQGPARGWAGSSATAGQGSSRRRCSARTRR